MIFRFQEKEKEKGKRFCLIFLICFMVAMEAFGEASLIKPEVASVLEDDEEKLRVSIEKDLNSDCKDKEVIERGAVSLTKPEDASVLEGDEEKLRISSEEGFDSNCKDKGVAEKKADSSQFKGNESEEKESLGFYSGLILGAGSLIGAAFTYFGFKLINDINVNKIDKHGDTSLISAIESKEKEFVKFLIKNGADVNKVDKYGRTPLYKAISHKEKEFVKFLVKNGADVNKANKYGETPLDGAIFYKDKELVGFLVENGADVNKVDQYGRTPLYKAIRDGAFDLAFSLIKGGADATKDWIEHVGSVMVAFADELNSDRVNTGKIVNGVFEVEPYVSDLMREGRKLIKYFVKNPLDGNKLKNPLDGNKLSDYLSNIYGNDKKVSNFLIKNEYKLSDYFLSLAIYIGDAKLVGFFIKNGANVNQKSDDNGQSMLIYAIESILFFRGVALSNNFSTIYKNRLKIVKLLIRNGADVNYRDSSGRSPLHHACNLGFLGACVPLVLNGADIYQKDKEGKTPDSLAYFKGSKLYKKFRKGLLMLRFLGMRRAYTLKSRYIKMKKCIKGVRSILKNEQLKKTFIQGFEALGLKGK